MEESEQLRSGRGRRGRGPAAHVELCVCVCRGCRGRGGRVGIGMHSSRLCVLGVAAAGVRCPAPPDASGRRERTQVVAAPSSRGRPRLSSFTAPVYTLLLWIGCRGGFPRSACPVRVLAKWTGQRDALRRATTLRQGEMLGGAGERWEHMAGLHMMPGAPRTGPPARPNQTRLVLPANTPSLAAEADHASGPFQLPASGALGPA